jgi:oxygen-dependent protoporphyrinogen oxidase
MVTGIYAGDPDRMSLRSCFPLIYDLEQKYGGLVKGMLSLQRERRKTGEKREMSAGPGGVLMSFDHGVQALTDILTDRLSDGIHLGVKVNRILRRNGKIVLSLEEEGQRGEIDTDVAVLATPAYSAAEMLGELDPLLRGALSAIPYSPISVVALGYDKATLGNPLDGFGFLIPRGEKRKILGALWDSSVFPNRAPEGKALIRVMVGGVRAPALAALPHAELLELVRAELSVTMGMTAEPILSRTFFHEKGIPQYLVGHGKVLGRIEERLGKVLGRIEERLAANPGIYLNSNAYRGIALNDCVLQSRLAAERIARELPAGTG